MQVSTSWHAIHLGKKDALHGWAFQFGTFVLPASECADPIGMFSGQAVVGNDGKVSLVRFAS